MKKKDKKRGKKLIGKNTKQFNVVTSGQFRTLAMFSYCVCVCVLRFSLRGLIFVCGCICADAIFVLGCMLCMWRLFFRCNIFAWVYVVYVADAAAMSATLPLRLL